MKEIKAFIRRDRIAEVVRGLEAAGFSNMTVIDVEAIRRGLSDEELGYSLELARRYMSVARLEIVVRDGDAELAIQTICDRARTGKRGDGLIYVMPVAEAIHILSGMGGELSVPSPSGESIDV